MITVKVDDKNWLQFPDGTPEKEINERVTKWIMNKEKESKRMKRELSDYLNKSLRNFKTESYSSELSRLVELNKYSVMI